MSHIYDPTFYKGSNVKAKHIATYTGSKKKAAAKKTALKAPPMPRLAKVPKSLDNPTLTLVIEFDCDHDLSGLLDSIQEIMDLARGDGNVISAELTNVPATLDCTRLDRRY